MKHRLSVCLVTVATSAVVLAACATMHVATHVDPTANFSKYRSFEIKRGLIVRNGAVDRKATDIQASIENALKEELMRKGLVPSAENPDIFVTYTQGARTRQELEQVWI